MMYENPKLETYPMETPCYECAGMSTAANFRKDE